MIVNTRRRLQALNFPNLLKDESADTVVPLAVGPHDKHISGIQNVRRVQLCLNEKDLRYWRIGNPSLASVEDKATIDFFGSGFHSCRIRTMVWLGKALKRNVRKQFYDMIIRTYKCSDKFSLS